MFVKAPKPCALPIIGVAFSLLLPVLLGCKSTGLPTPVVAGEPPPAVAPAPAIVLTGIDVLVRDQFMPLDGRRIGLITNHTGIDRDGVPTSRLLHDAPNVKLLALFSPEHGPTGTLDDTSISNSRDPATGLKIFSLYGESREPTTDMLEGIDTLVFDIQDIGTRYYTYISTMGNAMRAAARHGLRFMVLDRPNPINGLEVTGPVLDDGSQSFVGFHRIPVRHGMTVGELAMLFNAELGLNLDLEVVRMQGWQRRDFYSETGLPWKNPSPNMRNLTQALLYPGIGLLETTNLSVGRGTDTPFEVIGAPWLDGILLASRLNQLDLPGAAFIPVDFTPEESKFANELCHGVNIQITDRAQFRPVHTGLEIARLLRLMYPQTWDLEAYRRLLSSESTWQAIRDGRSIVEIETSFAFDLHHFMERRAPFLLYP